MIAGQILLTSFKMGAERVEMTRPDGSTAIKIALVAHLMDPKGEPVGSITIPMNVESVINMIVKIAGADLTQEERADLMAKLAVKGVQIAQPGDERRAAAQLAEMRGDGAPS